MDQRAHRDLQVGCHASRSLLLWVRPEIGSSMMQHISNVWVHTSSDMEHQYLWTGTRLLLHVACSV